MAGIDVQIGFSEASGGGFNPQVTLRADKLDVDMTRNPVVTGLPNQNAAGRGTSGHGSGVPRGLLIDFGLMEENLVISGSLFDEDPGAGIAVQDLMHSVRTQWVRMAATVLSSDGSSRRGIMKVRVPGSSPTTDLVWGVVPLRARFGRQGGELYWSYTLTFSVITWPEETSWGS